MYSDKVVLCGSNAYEQKYYFNKEFDKLPDSIKDELHIMCVMFTADVGGIMMLVYDGKGNLNIEIETDEMDLLFDEIGCGLKIKRIQQDKRELFEALEMFYKVFVLGEDCEV